MTREEFEQLVEDGDFESALDEFASECSCIKQNGYMGYYYRTDWYDIYGYPIAEKDLITCIEDIDDLFD